MGKDMMKKKSSRTVTVARGKRVARGKESEMRERKGSSSAGKYKKVAPQEFAGSHGEAARYSFPINTLKRARNALSRAHYSPNPAGIRSAVYKKYPQLKKRAQARKGSHGKKDEKEKKIQRWQTV
jgi:hypothetical protein